MNSRDFAFWLQGFFELTGNHAYGLNAEAVDVIRGNLLSVMRNERNPRQEVKVTDRLMDNRPLTTFIKDSSANALEHPQFGRALESDKT